MNALRMCSQERVPQEKRHSTAPKTPKDKTRLRIKKVSLLREGELLREARICEGDGEGSEADLEAGVEEEPLL